MLTRLLFRPIVWLCLLMCSHCLSTRVASGDFIINVRDTVITAGKNGTIDLTIRSTGNDTLGVFSYLLRITPIVESGGSLRFASTAAQTDAAKDDPNYVFGKESQSIVITRQDTTSIFEVVGSDIAANDVVVDGNERLLARVVLEHNAFNPLTATGSYKVSLVENDGFTFFQDLNDNKVAIAPESFANSAIANIVVTAVPEPSSIILAGIALPTLMAMRRRKRCRPA